MREVEHFGVVVGIGATTSLPNLDARRRRGELRLTRSAGRAADLAGRKARLAGGELDIDRAELGGLAGTAERSLAAELFQLFYLGAAGHLQRRQDRPPGAKPLSPEQTLRFKWPPSANVGIGGRESPI
jgi:type II secretory pathway pseudopilin PulG